jgi:hypothetical protein
MKGVRIIAWTLLGASCASSLTGNTTAAAVFTTGAAMIFAMALLRGKP